jgi:xanthine dehydrogenase accessory factor
MRPDLLALASGLAAREERFALVTVVRREAPSSARVGDVAVVTETGEYYGWVGGGCTRSTVLREARRAIADGEPRLLSLSPEPEKGRRAFGTGPRTPGPSTAPCAPTAETVAPTHAPPSRPPCRSGTAARPQRFA